MSRYYFISIKRKNASVLSEINNERALYELTLEKHSWFGLIKKIVCIDKWLPFGFSENQLKKGQQLILNTK